MSACNFFLESSFHYHSIEMEFEVYWINNDITENMLENLFNKIYNLQKMQMEKNTSLELNIPMLKKRKTHYIVK